LRIYLKKIKIENSVSHSGQGRACGCSLALARKGLAFYTEQKANKKQMGLNSK
jgi:hypothetical protein